MKSIVEKNLLLAGVVLSLASCGSFDGQRDGGPAPASGQPAAGPSSMISDGPTKLGAPFTVGDVTYTPADIPDYDDVGYATWYGAEFAGRPTANGEIFDPAGISAAHKTLPLPSYVEVTALDTGRTIVVRVNDRGPMHNDRLIDLSQAAAEQLGIANRPSAVRVRRTSPAESERAQLRSGGPVAERLATPDSLLAILRAKAAALPAPTNAVVPAGPLSSTTPKREDIVGSKPGDRFIVEGPGTKMPIAKPKPSAPPAAAAPVKSLGDYVVQVAAFGSRSRADAAAKAVGGTTSQAGAVWRVRMGPFASEAEALAALGKAKAKGYADARVMRDR